MAPKRFNLSDQSYVVHSLHTDHSTRRTLVLKGALKGKKYLWEFYLQHTCIVNLFFLSYFVNAWQVFLLCGSLFLVHHFSFFSAYHLSQGLILADNKGIQPRAQYYKKPVNHPRYLSSSSKPIQERFLWLYYHWNSTSTTFHKRISSSVGSRSWSQ